MFQMGSNDIHPNESTNIAVGGSRCWERCQVRPLDDGSVPIKSMAIEVELRRRVANDRTDDFSTQNGDVETAILD